MNEKPKTQRIDIQLDSEVGSGEYANFVVITHSPAEFVMDFTKILPGMNKAKVNSRIIMAPPHAKAFLSALSDNITRYEKKHGEIKLQGKDPFGKVGIKPPLDTLPN